MKTEIMADMGLVYTYGQALAIVFIAGVICFILTVAGLRMAIVHAIPDCVKSAMTAGIGLFIAQTINLYLSPIHSWRHSCVLAEVESCIMLSIRRRG